MKENSTQKAAVPVGKNASPVTSTGSVGGNSEQADSSVKFREGHTESNQLPTTLLHDRSVVRGAQGTSAEESSIKERNRGISFNDLKNAASSSTDKTARMNTSSAEYSPSEILEIGSTIKDFDKELSNNPYFQSKDMQEFIKCWDTIEKNIVYVSLNYTEYVQEALDIAKNDTRTAKFFILILNKVIDDKIGNTELFKKMKDILT